MADSFFIGGIHACIHCLTCSPESCVEMWLTPDCGSKLDTKNISTINTLSLPTHEVNRSTLTKIYGSESHNGIIIKRRMPNFLSLNNFFNSLESWESALFLVLDRIQDPRNFGACLRVAEAAGVTAVIFPNNNSALFDATLAKASSGAIDSLSMIRVSNIANTLRMLKQNGVWVFGADGASNNSVYDNDLKCAMALVMSNEGTGLRAIIRKNCDSIISLPMNGSILSLNVATATGIILYEANRQRT